MDQAGLRLALDGIANRDLQRGVVGLYVDRLDLDAIAEPLLEGALHLELHRGGQLIAERRKRQLHQSAAKGRTVDAFARGREEHLRDQVLDVLIGIGSRRASPAVEAEGKRDLRHRQITSRAPLLIETLADVSATLLDRKSTRLNSSHSSISYAVF